MPSLVRASVSILSGSAERRLLQPELMILLLQCRTVDFELFNLITVPHALEMLPGEHEHKKKNQYAQSQETETFTATLHVNFPQQAGIVDVLHKIKFREMRAARGRDGFSDAVWWSVM